jgi:hypothetical protein
MTKRSWMAKSSLVVLALLIVIPAPHAAASTNCRATARDIQLQLVKVLQANANDVLGAQVVLNKAGISYPECIKEIQEVIDWNKAGVNSGPWPFPQSGDPKSYPLGPISWWWDAIWISLFGRNYILMFLFGWEIFLAPLGLILPIIAALFGGIGAGFNLIGKILFWRKGPKNRPENELPDSESD